MFKFLMTPFLLLISLSTAQASPELGCYSRTYSAEHMASHKTQSLKSITLEMDYSVADGTPEFVIIKGISAQGGLEYQYVGTTTLNNQTICAGFVGDGDQDMGCVSIKRIDEKTISISPVVASYDWGIGETWSGGLQLRRCEGYVSDGEGCMDTYKTILLQPSNKQDLDYRLKKVSCNSL